MSEQDKKYIPEGVFLVCDKGEMVSQLLADSSRTVKIYGSKACVETDNKFGVHIIPFGACQTCETCTFAEIEWTKVKQKGVTFNGIRPLLEHSEGICKEGKGTIKIYFDEYEAGLANENNNESAFVKESISSQLLGNALTFPFGEIMGLFSDDVAEFTEGVGRGFKKGLQGTWDFLTSDMWKADTWKGMGKLAVIGVAYSSPLGPLVGDSTLQALDNQFETDFKQTKDNLVEGVQKTIDNAVEDVKRGNYGEVGETVGQVQYVVVEALIGSKGAGLAVKGATTEGKILVGAERLAQLASSSAKWMNKLKTRAIGLVRTGSKFKIPQGLTKLQFDELSKYLRDKVGHLSDDIAIQGSRAKGTAKSTSDIDIAIKVDEETFNKMIKEYFGTPNPGSAKERTMQHAIATGKITTRPANLSRIRQGAEEVVGMEVDLSIIKKGGAFDNPPYIPIK